MTKAKGAVYVTISPTFKKGMNWVIAITKKNILKKKTHVNMEYFYQADDDVEKRIYLSDIQKKIED